MTNPKPLSPEERVEAALKAVDEPAYAATMGYIDEDDVRTILRAAYPELASGTHVLLPREPTEEMVQRATEEIRALLNEEEPWADAVTAARNAYAEFITAYESTSTKTEEQ